MGVLPTAYFENGDPLYDGFVRDGEIWGYRHSLEETRRAAEPQVIPTIHTKAVPHNFFEDGAPAYGLFMRDGDRWGFRVPVKSLGPCEYQPAERVTRVKMPAVLGAPYDLSPRFGFGSTSTTTKPRPLYQHNEDVILSQRSVIGRLEAENIQLRFLLDQAPMLNAPENLERAAHSVTKFAYAHPATFQLFTRALVRNPEGRSPLKVYPSPTEWILTNLMPLGRVIYSPNLIPGLEVRP